MDRPLGPIIEIYDGEAITQPQQSFVAKGAKVVTTSNKTIGKLDYPIGRVDKPYQVIKLNSHFEDDLVGELVIAKISKKQKRRRRNKKRN